MESIETTIACHLDDLRKTLILSLLSLLFGFILSLPLAAPFVSLLKKPAEDSIHRERIIVETAYNSTRKPLSLTLPEDNFDVEFQEGVLKTHNTYQIPPGGSIVYKRHEAMPQFVLLGPIQGFSILMKCTLFLGAVISSPLWLFAVWRFIAPGLKKRERGLLIPFFASMLLFFTGGAVLGYFFILPTAIDYMEHFGGDIGTNMWSLSAYLEFCLFILFGAGMILEIFFFLLLLVHFKFLSYKQLYSIRRVAIVGCFILGALFTPPDIPTQIMLAIPLWLFFEICVAYSYVKSK